MLRDTYGFSGQARGDDVARETLNSLWPDTKMPSTETTRKYACFASHGSFAVRRHARTAGGWIKLMATVRTSSCSCCSAVWNLDLCARHTHKLPHKLKPGLPAHKNTLTLF